MNRADGNIPARSPQNDAAAAVAQPPPCDGARERPLALFSLMTLAALVTGVVVNLILSLLPDLTLGAQLICYSLLFVILISPAVYWFVFRPVARQIAERQFAHAAERRQMEDSRARALEKYRAIFENAIEGIYQTTPDGRHLAANPALARMLGYASPEELITSVTNVESHLYVDPGRRAEFKRLVEEHGVVERFECQLRRKDGSTVWVSENARAVRAPGGQVLYYEGTLEDITVRKQMEETLRHSEEVFRSIIENLTDMVMVMQANHAISFGSPSIQRILDYRPEDYLGKDVFTFLHPDDAAGATAAIERALKNPGVPQSTRLRVRHKDGSWRVLESTGKTILGPQGPTSIVVTCRDVTEQKKAEEERLRLSTVIEQAGESIVITDPNGAILYVNPAFEKISGYSRQETLGQNPRLLKSGKHDVTFYQQMWDTLLRGEVWVGRITNKKKDGSLFEEDACISPVRDAAGKTVNYVAVKRDVTHEAALESQLRQSQKMEAVGRLAGGVAHDFNNILTAILGYGELALRRLDPNDPLRGYLTEVKQSAERAASLTRQLLAFSRKQVLVPQVLDLNTLVANLQKMLGRLIGEDIHFATELAPVLGRIKADAGQIEQVIVNLAINARDAMPRGGSLIIATADADLDAAYAQQQVEVKPGRYVMLAITDTGIGMTPEVKAHLFEPFFTTKEQGKGTGLGLATVYGIVMQSGGHIAVESEVNRGTTFRIYLPRLENGADTTTLPRGSATTPGGSETILLVEDELNVRKLSREFLAASGYTVLEAKDATEALKIAENYHATIHLLMTDVVLPGLNSNTMVRLLTTTRPDIRVLYVSGYTDTTLVSRDVLRSGAAFLQKPFTPDALTRKVREILDSPRPRPKKP